MNNLLLLIGIILLSSCANNTQIINHQSKGNLAATNPLGCVSATSVKPASTAADITTGAKVCAHQSKYNNAAELIMVASAYAYFDTQRVSDKTAHSALNALFAKEFGSLPEAERQALFASIDDLNKDDAKKQEICHFLKLSEPPSYMPNYMIEHGMGAFTDSGKEPLVKDFNANEGWAKSMGFVSCGN